MFFNAFTLLHKVWTKFISKAKLVIGSYELVYQMAHVRKIASHNKYIYGSFLTHGWMDLIEARTWDDSKVCDGLSILN
jgi:hypothetical protein